MFKQKTRGILFLVIFGLMAALALTINANAQTNTSASTFDLGNNIDQFQKWMESHSDQDIVEALSKFDLNQVLEWLDAKSETKNQIEHLKQQIQENEVLLDQKRKGLHEIEAKLDLLKLTPSQVDQIEKYNQSLKPDPHFAEWITERGTWFEIGKDFFISLLFLMLGILIEAKRKQKKERGFNVQPRRSKKK